MPRSSQGIYTSPFGDPPSYSPGTIWEYACGWSTHQGAKEDNDEGEALVEVGTEKRWT